MAVNVTFDSLNVGDAIPEWSRETDFMNWNRYAAVNDEFVFIHMDDEAGKAALNEQGAFGMGNLRYTYMLNALRDWLGDEAEGRHRFAYFPFGGGPRVCIGNHFAKMEAILVLATVLREYRFEPVANFRPELMPAVTLRPKHGMELRIRRRESLAHAA